MSRDYGKDKRSVSLVYQNADALWEPDDHYYAFLCLQRLQSLRFAPETKSIAAWHFYGCSNLQQLLFPNGLEKIGAGAFANCTALEEVVIPESVTEIEPKAFFKCTALRCVQISDALLQTLDDRVFAMTPWMQMRLPEEPLHRFNDVLVASLGFGASYVLPIFTDKMNGEQDLLLIDPNNAPYRQSELHAAFLSIAIHKIVNTHLEGRFPACLCPKILKYTKYSCDFGASTVGKSARRSAYRQFCELL